MFARFCLRFSGSSSRLSRLGRQFWLVLCHPSRAQPAESNGLRIELGVRRSPSEHPVQPGRQSFGRQCRLDFEGCPQQTAGILLAGGRTESHHGLRSPHPFSNGSCPQLFVVCPRAER